MSGTFAGGNTVLDARKIVRGCDTREGDRETETQRVGQRDVLTEGGQHWF